MTKVAIVYHSGGNRTGRQAEAIARGCASVPGVETRTYSLSASQVGPDMRWRDREMMEELKEMDGIIFGSVTYFGTVSAVFKSFLEGTFGLWYDQSFKDKWAGGFTNSGSFNGDKQVTLMMLLTYAAQMGMFWVPMGDHPGANHAEASQDDINRLGAFLGPMAMSEPDSDPSQFPTPGDILTAERYGERFASVVRHWTREGNYVTPRAVDAAATAALKKAGISASDAFLTS
ncbi:MAG: flavodoxin family protein [Parvibaculum sp.]|nr:flavodoxin family protein [Parvibaculum sp.]